MYEFHPLLSAEVQPTSGPQCSSSGRGGELVPVEKAGLGKAGLVEDEQLVGYF